MTTEDADDTYDMIQAMQIIKTAKTSQAPKKPTEVVDLISHPPHYMANGVESIDVIEHYRLGFALGNAVKYLLRAGRKSDDARTDLSKAQWYLVRAGARTGYDYQFGDADYPRPSPEAVIEAFGLDEYRAEVIRCLLVKRIERGDVIKAGHYLSAALKQAMGA